MTRTVVIVSLRGAAAAAGFTSALRRVPDADVRIVDSSEAWPRDPALGEANGALAGMLLAAHGTVVIDRAITPAKDGGVTRSHAAMRPRGGLAPFALRRVRDFVDAHLAEKIRLSDLASLTGVLRRPGRSR